MPSGFEALAVPIKKAESIWNRIKSAPILLCNMIFFFFFKILEEVENVFLFQGEGTAAKSTRADRFCEYHSLNCRMKKNLL